MGGGLNDEVCSVTSVGEVVINHLHTFCDIRLAFLLSLTPWPTSSSQHLPALAMLCIRKHLALPPLPAQPLNTTFVSWRKSQTAARNTSRRRQNGKQPYECIIHVKSDSRSLYRVDRLGSILAKRNLAPSKLDEIKIKANILKSFVEDRTEATKETVARAESEL